MIAIRSRRSWGASPAEGSLKWVDPYSRMYAFLHYSLGEELGNRDIQKWLQNIQKYHQGSNNWSDIGYNLLVDNNGDIWEGRGLNYAGAHCPNFNVLGYGICYLGDDDPGVTDVSMKAKVALRDVFAELDRLSGKQLTRLGHRDRRATTCPGDELYAWLRAGMPVNVVVPKPSPPLPSRPEPSNPAAPSFPLARGHWFGQPSSDSRNHSGYYSRTDRHQLARWQAQMRARGWKVNVDGLFTEQTRAVAVAFQKEKRLTADGRVGVLTWNRAWTAPTTN